MNDENAGGFFITGFIFGFVIAAGLVSWSFDNYYERRAIANHAAQYNQETGEFEWNDERKP